MIVRILGEGQYELDDVEAGEFTRLDDALGRHVEEGDEEAYRRDLAALLEYVHRNATTLGDDDFRPSDQVLPDPSSSLAEVKALLEEEHAGS
jgi:PspA-Associated protein